jgi:TPR repeat protein
MRLSSAMRPIRLAADQDYANAQYNLGVLYFFGEGVPQNYVNADMWLNLRAAHGDKNSVQFRDLVQQRMTPAQITKAHKLASEWKPTREPPR